MLWSQKRESPVATSAPHTTNLLSHVTAASSSKKFFLGHTLQPGTLLWQVLLLPSSAPVNPTGGWIIDYKYLGELNYDEYLNRIKKT
jgi:hypothetical protein